MITSEVNTNTVIEQRAKNGLSLVKEKLTDFDKIII